VPECVILSGFAGVGRPHATALAGCDYGVPGDSLFHERDAAQAIDDYQAGRLGTVPADQLAPRNFA